MRQPDPAGSLPVRSVRSRSVQPESVAWPEFEVVQPEAEQPREPAVDCFQVELARRNCCRTRFRARVASRS